MNAPLYTVEILRLAGSLPDPVRLERVDGAAQLRSPTCGSTVNTEVQMEGEVVAGLSQQVRACAFGQAAAALVVRHAVGRTRDEVAEALAGLTRWLEGGRDDPGGWGLEALAPARSRTSRHGAIVLPLRALLAAIEDARS
ncbi:iron-sulfur cluster assembly scaffold protein [Sphingomonas sp.]|uniref:iron-sulfur cluster assembly scaffold protein n=1 Tax=Sphingomonas sp. TaxID=28214 RepID=UPI0017DC2FE7|nr:iron-sulfur cluster assembly scaffold protein [Sphingomonas sp.]MBA3510863.1 iron-sulfur cluster assembly scaffold protein [Sphingomonas sp.]